MDTGNNDVRKEISIGASDLIGPLMRVTRTLTKGQGAMSQQGFGAHGNECYPQKLVQLVGYRGPCSAESWDRLRLKRGATQAAD